MKILTILLTVIILVWLIAGIGTIIYATYQYERTVESYWELADKASTLDQKCEYLEKFSAALDAAKLDEYNAIFYETPNNSLAQNKRAMKSLLTRLEEIRGMNPKSFEYQQAMFQITAQEQGEAKAMLEVFFGCWLKANHFFLWGWVGLLHSLVWIVCGCITVMLWGFYTSGEFD